MTTKRRPVTRSHRSVLKSFQADADAERQRREDARIMALHSAFSKLSVHIDDPTVTESDLEPEVREQILAILRDIEANGI